MRSPLQIGRAQCVHVTIKTQRGVHSWLAENLAVTSRWIFSFTFCKGSNASKRARSRRWNNIWPFAAVDFHQVIQLCCTVRACLRSIPLHLVHAWHGAAAVVYYPNCIIALCLRGYNVSRCICHGAPRTRSVKWLNCFVHAITKLLTIYNQSAGPRFSPINFMNAAARASSFFGLFASVHKSTLPFAR